LGEDRALVSDIPGTTLDYNVGSFEYRDQEYRLYDTAGIRRK
jgi:predicted GTPase